MNSSNSLSENARFSTIWSEFRCRVGYYFCFSKAVFFASGLLFSDKLIDYSILRLSAIFLIDYTKEIDERNFMNAAMLSMILLGPSALLELIVLKYMSKSLLSGLLVLMVSTFCYLFGLMQVRFWVPDEYAKLTQTQNIIGILLLALAHAGVQPVIGEFIVEQFRKCEPDPANIDEDRVIARKNVWCRIVWTFSAVAALVTWRLVEKYISSSIHLEKLLFIVPLCAIASSLILIVCGTLWLYLSGVLTNIGSLLATIPRNLMALLIKMRRLGISKQDRDSSTSPEQRETAHGRKLQIYIRKMGSMWSTFLLFGVILSGGNNIFPLQGIILQINSEYLPCLVIIQSVSCRMVSFLFELLLVKWVPKAEQGKAKLVRMWLGMLLSVPCFIVALRVGEIGVQNPDRTMSIFGLVPQFCLLGFMEGLAQDGLDDIMVDLFPETRKRYLSAINTFVIGLGNFANPLIFRGISKVSSLEEYFKILIIIASVNLCYHSCISLIFYNKKEYAADSDHVNARRPSDDSRQSKCLPDILAAFI